MTIRRLSRIAWPCAAVGQGHTSFGINHPNRREAPETRPSGLNLGLVGKPQKHAIAYFRALA
jgi:hypothetical protein